MEFLVSSCTNEYLYDLIRTLGELDELLLWRNDIPNFSFPDTLKPATLDHGRVISETYNFSY